MRSALMRERTGHCSLLVATGNGAVKFTKQAAGGRARTGKKVRTIEREPRQLCATGPVVALGIADERA